MIELAAIVRDLAQEINRMISDIDFGFSLRSNGAMLVKIFDYDPEDVITQQGRAAYESEVTSIIGINTPGVAEFFVYANSRSRPWQAGNLRHPLYKHQPPPHKNSAYKAEFLCGG